jgi:linoleoyl-CoA desaturase
LSAQPFESTEPSEERVLSKATALMDNSPYGPRPEFSGSGDFYTELKQRVNAFVSEPTRATKARRALHRKAAVLFTWAAGSWYLLMFQSHTWWLAVLWVVSLALAIAGIGFSVVHDANHGAWSANPRANRAMRWAFDLIGGSSYVWRMKHNVLHHTYTNVAGIDDDIEVLPLARFAPEQPRRWFHRFQHIYLWPMYGLVALKWHTSGDFESLVGGHICETPIAWPKGKDLAGFWIGKLAFFSWALFIPLMVHSWWQVLVIYAIGSFVLGQTMTVTFQLAHCVEEAEFPSRAEMHEQGKVDWARHQVETTVDFAQRNPFLTYYMGGLNFQIEHHLFTKVCHTHYPSIAPIVREVCEKYGVHYSAHPTIWKAISSHTRWLYRMGHQEMAPAS